METAGVAALLKSGGDFPLCSYCEDGFMHCSTSGAPGSLLPDAVLSSPLSHRSEYCLLEGLLTPCPDRAPWGGGESGCSV